MTQLADSSLQAFQEKAHPTISPAKITSRDEMNLAEFPLAVLSTRTDPNLKTLEFSDFVRGKNGEQINRKWIITGADKFGLPTASDDEVLLGLMKLTSDSLFSDRKVFFTRYELLRILRWTTEGRSYSRLQKALDRLSGVRIKTTNGFYDNETKLHSTRNFGIIDAYEINDGRGGRHENDVKPSFFIWSEAIFKSFQSGFIKKLDLNFLLDLQSAVSKRLYRYLDKHFWYKSRVQHKLFVLAHEKLGISRNYAFASQLKQQLDPAVEELVKKGFLVGCEYVGKGSDTEVIFYSANGARKESKKLSAPAQMPFEVPHTEDFAIGKSDAGHKLSKDKNRAQSAKTNQCEIIFSDENLPSDLAAEIRAALTARGIRPQQANTLIASADHKALMRIKKIIEYFDELVSSGSQKVSRSPVGFLYRAVENPASFVLPGERLDNPKPQPVVKAKAVSLEHKLKANRSLEAAYLSERRLELSKLREEVEPEMLAKISKEVEQALLNVKSLISPSKFKAAIEQGVEDRLARLFDLPEFDEWKERR